ncbi:F-box-domain-containing protein [Aspergillus terreus]|uniref:F-box-domain-containing protein n=1 Tax=Aspergillus terreus TaxID=33178 RepID=A0A5M3YVL0_ASPTE|nr:hypothetical protein ATETN484_0004086500 [Aspergillus terreus]GFF13933.1 F-box-domain-containing protein [Aspergillus terreus]
MLLNLPAELVQLVLQHCRTPDFLEAAFSCRALYEIATNCREVLLHHLYLTPGVEFDPQLKSRHLFRLLVRRAFQQLYGTQFYASSTQYTFGSAKQTLDVKASAFSHDRTTLGIALKGHGDVTIFRAENRELRQAGRLCSPFMAQSGSVEVLRTAFDRDGGVYVLQRFTPAVDAADADHPFVRQALASNGAGYVYLVRHSLRSPHDPVRMCSFPDHAEYEPLALAAAHRDTFAISWQHKRDENDTEVVLYNIQDQSSSAGALGGLIELEYNSCILVGGTQENDDDAHFVHPSMMTSALQNRGPIINLAFNDRSSQLLYYYKARTLYGSFQRVNMSSYPVQPTMYGNACTVQFDESLVLLFSIDIPFFGTHETIQQDGRSMCHWKYLSFGVARHRSEDWTVACLLRSEALCSSHNCQHVLNLERGRRFPDWTIVARLWGFEDATDSLGCRVAASKRGTRIAVANWNLLYVWAVEPGSLIEQNKDGFYPPSSQAGPGVTVLHPVVLPLNAVCFQLQFTQDEDELVAITDRGLMYWNLSPLGGGRKVVEHIAS